MAHIDFNLTGVHELKIMILQARLFFMIKSFLLTPGYFEGLTFSLMGVYGIYNQVFPYGSLKFHRH